MASDEVLKQKLLDRLNRIEGQVRGIKRMLSEERGCFDVMKQVAAVSGALRSLQKVMLERHLEGCLKRAAASDPEGRQLLHELTEHLGDLIG